VSRHGVCNESTHSDIQFSHMSKHTTKNLQYARLLKVCPAEPGIDRAAGRTKKHDHRQALYQVQSVCGHEGDAILDPRKGPLKRPP